MALVACARSGHDPRVAPGVIENGYAGVILDGEALPGGPAAVWPEPIAYAGGRYLVPYVKGSAALARLTGSGDVALGDGALLGACAHGDGFAVALVDGDRVRVRFLDGNGAVAGDTAVSIDGDPLPSLASDGTQVLVVSSTRAPHVNGPDSSVGHGWLIGPRGVTSVELGAIDPAQPTFGDGRGFIVGGGVLVTSDGLRASVGPAPGAQVAGARVFYRVVPVDGKAVTFDGARWLGLERLPVRASRDDDGALLTLAGAGGGGDMLLHLGADLSPLDGPHPVPVGADGNGAVQAVRGGVALWHSTLSTVGGMDHLLARLDRASLEPIGPARRITGAASRTVVAVLGDTDGLAAWVDADGHVRVAQW